MTLEELQHYKYEKKPPHNFIDLTGWENEYLKVIDRALDKNKVPQWNCLCKSCQTYCVKNSRNLKRDKSCGCQKSKLIGEHLRKDLTGKQFGLLKVKKFSGKSNSSGNAIWICECKCGNIVEVDSNNLTSSHTLSCGCINYSIGAKTISSLLLLNKIKFNSEYPIQELCDKSSDHPFRFDFAILDSNHNPIRFIEYDGIQHYKQTWGIWKSNISLEQQQDRDKRKNEYALSRNIPLVRIPYWERDNITLEMIMGDQYLVKKDV